MPFRILQWRVVGLETGAIGQAKKNGNPIMCCGRRRSARGIRNIAQNMDAPNDLALVVSSTPEPIYGCVTGTQYPFDEHKRTLFMDVRDIDCLPEKEYSVL